MNPAARMGVLVSLIAGAAGVAEAQVLQLYATDGDSALSVVVGDSAPLRLQVTGATGGIKGYTVTLFLDDARVQLVRADSVPGYSLASPTFTPPGGDQVTLTLPATGTGYNSTSAQLADLWFRMDPAAVEGSLISMRLTSLTNFSDVDILANHRTNVFNVCQAVTYWGDLTGEHAVTSRDALVALTAAVGLPTGGMDLQFGDVDEDGMVTSRDALLILSHSIGLYTGVLRLSRAKANRCAPLYPTPDPMLFFRSATLFQVAAGDTVPTPLTLPITPYSGYRVVWSPDQQEVLFVASVTSFSYEVLRSAFPFTRVDTLARNASADWASDWSPDGTRIAFISQRVLPTSVFVMNADGALQSQVTFAPVQANTSYEVAWQPQPGQRIAFIGDSSGTSAWGIWTVHPDSSQPIEVLPGSLGHNPQMIAWNAAGDSIYYRHTSGEIYAVPNLPGSTGVLASRVSGGGESPMGTSQGLAYRSFTRFPYDWFLRRASDGRHLRILRGTSTGEYRGSVRGTSVYVQSVTIAPKPVTVTYPAVQAVTATVLNSNAVQNTSAPVTWTSRNTGIATLNLTGPQSANIVSVTAGVTYVVATVRGWRTDSVLVTVN